MASLNEFCLDKIQMMLENVGFQIVSIEDITANVAPSVLRLRRYFYVPYYFVKLFMLQSRFPNLTGVVEFAKMGQKGMFMYKIFTAEKRCCESGC
jgi:hypothetical protein